MEIPGCQTCLDSSRGEHAVGDNPCNGGLQKSLYIALNRPLLNRSTSGQGNDSVVHKRRTHLDAMWHSAVTCCGQRATEMRSDQTSSALKRSRPFARTASNIQARPSQFPQFTTRAGRKPANNRILILPFEWPAAKRVEETPGPLRQCRKDSPARGRSPRRMTSGTQGTPPGAKLASHQ